MATLETLPSIARLSDRVLRVLGQNPGKVTLQGTNTYLLGRGNPFILLDTGEGNESYISCLDDALKQTTDPSQPLISDIILTHRHRDHTHGLPSVLALLRRRWGHRPGYRPPRVHKFPLPSNSLDPDLQSMLDELLPHSFVPDSTRGGPTHDIQTLQTFHGNETTLQVLHTPGHTPDSICIYLAEEGAVFTADTVLGQGTAVFEDLSAYLSSLRYLLSFGSQLNKHFVRVYPGHGPVVEDGPKLIKSYIEHRMRREDQIMEVLSSAPPSGETWTLDMLVAKIYAEYPQSLWPSAGLGIRLHLDKLEKEGKVRNLGGEMQDMMWRLTSKI